MGEACRQWGVKQREGRELAAAKARNAGVRHTPPLRQEVPSHARRAGAPSAVPVFAIVALAVVTAVGIMTAAMFERVSSTSAILRGAFTPSVTSAPAPAPTPATSGVAWATTGSDLSAWLTLPLYGNAMPAIAHADGATLISNSAITDDGSALSITDANAFLARDVEIDDGKGAPIVTFHPDAIENGRITAGTISFPNGLVVDVHGVVIHEMGDE